MGLPGAGKSHFSERLARGMSDCTLINVDQFRAEICPEATFSQTEHLTVYSALAGYALAHLQRETSVILDGNYNTSERRRLPLTIARSTGARCIALWLEVPSEIGAQRIRSRKHRWREPPLVILQRMRTALEDPTTEEQRTFTVAHIDGAAMFETQYQQLLMAKNHKKTHQNA